MTIPERRNAPVGDRGASNKSFPGDTPSIPATAPTRPDLPLAPVLCITAGQSTRLVLILCPLCGKKHTHGLPWGTDATSPQTRVRHCAGRALRALPDDAPTRYRLDLPIDLGPNEVAE